MKIILGSKRHPYLSRVSIFFLIVAGLIVWMTGCYTCFPKEYTLIISSTEGGSVTDPGEETFTYNSGTVVDLVATPDAGYHFVEWTGDVSTIADVNAATTTITMNGSYNITANFALEIWDWYDLDAIRDNLGGSYILMKDLDSTTAGYEELASPTANGGHGWEPIGTFDNQFTGTFDGQGYEIKDLFINRPDEDYVGLFSGIDEAGFIENVGVVNANVLGYEYTGSLVGRNDGAISNSYSAGNVISKGNVVGGLIGYNYYGTVSNSYSSGNVTGEGWVGGLVGQNCGSVSNSYSSAEVVGSYRLVGGLVGSNVAGSTVSNSYSSGSVTGDDDVGGLMGANVDTVSNSYSTGNVTGEGNVGGLIGSNWGTVSNSYSTGSVSGNLSVGGLVGSEPGDGTVSNSFWDTETSGQSTSDGGTGKTTAEMQDIATFSGAAWDIIAVANPGIRNLSYIWNIVDDETYPFLSWQS